MGKAERTTEAKRGGEAVVERASGAAGHTAQSINLSASCATDNNYVAQEFGGGTNY